MPGIRNLDLSLQKKFAITETKRIEFRAETFNLTNTPVFTGVGNSLGTATFAPLRPRRRSAKCNSGLKSSFF